MLAIAGCIVVSWPCPLAMYPPVCSPLWPPAGLRRETENKQTKRTEQWFKIKCKKWEKKEKNKRCKHSHKILPEDQHLGSPQAVAPLKKPLTNFIADCDVRWHETVLWSIWFSCQSCVPSQPVALPQPTCLGTVWKTGSAKTLVCY